MGVRLRDDRIRCVSLVSTTVLIYMAEQTKGNRMTKRSKGMYATVKSSTQPVSKADKVPTSSQGAA